MKKFPIKFKLITNIMFIIIGLVLSFLIYFNIRKMYDSGFDSRTLWLYIILLIFTFTILVLIINIAFFSKYKVSANYIHITLSIFTIKIEIKKIDKIISYEKNKETFIVYTKNEILKNHLISIDYSNQKPFIDLIKSVNRNIIHLVESENSDDIK